MAPTSDVDMSQVAVDVRYDGDDTCGTCVTKLLYKESVVCEWYGLSEKEVWSGVRDAQLSRSKAILTLFGEDGIMKVCVPELVEGWLLGAGCPEPAKSLQTASTSDVDMSQVSLDVRQDYDDTWDTTHYVTKLLYKESVVCEWHGLCEKEVWSGTRDVQLSQNKEILTLFGADGRSKMSWKMCVPELVEGWLLEAGCPEPEKSLQTACKKKEERVPEVSEEEGVPEVSEEDEKVDAPHVEQKKGEDHSAVGSAVLRVASPSRKRPAARTC